MSPLETVKLVINQDINPARVADLSVPLFRMA